MDKPLFKLITLKEERVFLDTLPDKVREIKKTQKTPQRDKDKAKAIRKEWFDNKNK